MSERKDFYGGQELRAKGILSGAQCWGVAFCVLALFLVGCSTMPKVHTPTLAEQPDCVTSLEGFYHCKDTWIGATPALVLESKRKSKRSKDSTSVLTVYKVIVGRIVSIDDDGVTFSTGKDDSSLDSKSVYYPYDQIAALIDDDHKTVYGDIPRKYSTAQSMELWIELANQYYGDPTTHKIVLQPNEPFSFCFPGGEYDVKAIFFKDGNNGISQGIDYPKLTIKLTRGYANYIGHICLSLQKPELPDSLYVPMGFAIPYKRLSGSTSSELGLFGALAGGAVGGAIGGAVGGAIGDALDASSNDSDEKSGDKKVLIAIDKKFQPRCKSALKQNIIKVKKHVRSN